MHTSNRSTQPFTLRETVKWVPAKGRWCSADGEQRQAWCNLQVKLCDQCLIALEVVTTMCYTDRRILYFTLLYFTLLYLLSLIRTIYKLKEASTHKSASRRPALFLCLAVWSWSHKSAKSHVTTVLCIVILIFDLSTPK